MPNFMSARVTSHLGTEHGRGSTARYRVDHFQLGALSDARLFQLDEEVRNLFPDRNWPGPTTVGVARTGPPSTVTDVAAFATGLGVECQPNATIHLASWYVTTQTDSTD
jgi:hypothetical protein